MKSKCPLHLAQLKLQYARGIRGRFNSVGRALDCRAGGRGFDSRGQTNTQGLKITEK